MLLRNSLNLQMSEKVIYFASFFEIFFLGVDLLHCLLADVSDEKYAIISIFAPSYLMSFLLVL